MGKEEAALYKFTDDCLIGIEQLDSDHKKLFELINEVLRLLGNQYIPDKYNQIKEIVASLQDYADCHFIREEAYMAAINDPELDLQKKQHMQFREKMNVMDIFQIDEPEQQQTALTDLMNYLTRWLYTHIINSDILIGKMPPLNEWRNTKNPCEFTDHYKTGIPFIDGEHRTLFEIIAEANRLVQDRECFDRYDEIVTVLNRLKDYTEEHFRDEEEYMESIHYSGLEAQKLAHQSFITKLREINLEQMDDNQQLYLEELTEFLFSWLSNHILKSDKMICEM